MSIRHLIYKEKRDFKENGARPHFFAKIYVGVVRMSIRHLIFKEKEDWLLFEFERCHCERSEAISSYGNRSRMQSASYFTLASNWLIFRATGLAPLSSADILLQ
jgi:hypothetical protein